MSFLGILSVYLYFLYVRLSTLLLPECVLSTFYQAKSIIRLVQQYYTDFKPSTFSPVLFYLIFFLPLYYLLACCHLLCLSFSMPFSIYLFVSLSLSISLSLSLHPWLPFSHSRDTAIVYSSASMTNKSGRINIQVCSCVKPLINVGFPCFLLIFPCFKIFKLTKNVLSIQARHLFLTSCNLMQVC